ncbi:MAG TPA: MarC family protein [Gemmatimonadales bacterium]|nr:MarC family protein [Gemmatimonadales bacterium]
MTSYNFSAFALLCLSSLLAIINPLTTAPLYLSITDGHSPRERERALRTAIVTGITVLVAFALLGGAIFAMFGITIHAFRIAGGLILFGIGLDMLQAKRSRVRATAEEVQEGLEKEDVGVTPLGVPMIVGPGSITTVMVLMGNAAAMWQVFVVLGSVFVILGFTYAVLFQAPRILNVIGSTGINVMTRLMGLLVAVIAVQFVVDGIRPLLVEIMRAAAGGV